jgi:predicted Fe-Mo cluster-binding NifX family protein
MRVAVASEDGETIQQHFGKTTQFMVYELDGDQCRLLEVRENEPACHPGRSRQHGAYLAESIALIADCRVVLASQIGPVAEAHLLQHNVLPLRASGVIHAALLRLARYFQRAAKEQPAVSLDVH